MLIYLSNIIYTFILGYFFQRLIYIFINEIKYAYNKKFFKFLKITTGIIYAFLWIEYGYSFKFLIYSLSSTILMCLSFIDSEYMIIPDELNLGLLFLGLTNVMVNSNNPSTYIQGFLFGGIIYLLIAIVTNGGMGGGDIKLMSCLGFIVGLKGIFFIITATFVVSGVGIIYIIFFKKKNIREFIPYGPFISATTLLYFLMIGN